MKLVVKRKAFLNDCTTGELHIDGKFFCYTLEDTVRDKKIDKITAIPYGKYKLILDFSNRFQKIMPHVLDVPGFEGIRIHPGNSATDTEGCLLLGNKLGKGFVGNSRDAFTNFMNLIKDEKDMTIEYIKED